MRPFFCSAALAAVTLLIAGCGVRKDYAFSYTKEGVSEQQYLDDQMTLRNTPGVQYVHGERSPEGKAALDVGVKEGYDLLIQEKMLLMGWTRGQH